MTRKLMILLAVFTLFAAACGDDDSSGTTTAAPTTTEAPAPSLGTPEDPIRVLFVPSVDTQVITTGGELMAQALNEATGLTFDVAVPTSYAATAEEMCASPDNTVGFIPGLLYVLATELCGVDVSFKAIRHGHSVYWAQILVPRDSDAKTIDDLQGLTWAYGDAGSTSSFMYPSTLWQQEGIEFDEKLEAGNHNAAALAVYRGEADVGTTFFSPYLNLVEGGAQWTEDLLPDIPDDLVESCAPNDDGSKLLCGDLRVLDARASVRTEAPDIVQKVRILDISPAIPNDTLSFGSAFPPEVRTQIEDALVAWAAECDDNEDCDWNKSIGDQDFYGWTSIARANDSEYDIIRGMVAANE